MNKVGIGNQAAYQVSAIPYASGSIEVPDSGSSPVEISFPNVSRFVTVKNTGTPDIRVGFSENGVEGANYFSLAQDESYTGEWKIVRLYILSEGAAGEAAVIAGLTSIGTEDLESGALDNWSGSDGVG